MFYETAADELRAEAKADYLLRLLRHRFGALPPAVVRRVEDALGDELDGWFDRALRAGSLASVFSDAGTVS